MRVNRFISIFDRGRAIYAVNDVVPAEIAVQGIAGTVDGDLEVEQKLRAGVEFTRSHFIAGLRIQVKLMAAKLPHRQAVLERNK